MGRPGSAALTHRQHEDRLIPVADIGDKAHLRYRGHREWVAPAPILGVHRHVARPPPGRGRGSTSRPSAGPPLVSTPESVRKPPDGPLPIVPLLRVLSRLSRTRPNIWRRSSFSAVLNIVPPILVEPSRQKKEHLFGSDRCPMQGRRGPPRRRRSPAPSSIINSEKRSAALESTLILPSHAISSSAVRAAHRSSRSGRSSLEYRDRTTRHHISLQLDTGVDRPIRSRVQGPIGCAGIATGAQSRPQSGLPSG